MPVPLHPGAEKYYKEVGVAEVSAAIRTRDGRCEPRMPEEAAFDETGVKRELDGRGCDASSPPSRSRFRPTS